MRPLAFDSDAAHQGEPFGGEVLGRESSPSARALVETVVARLGVDPGQRSRQGQTRAQRTWTLQRGSAADPRSPSPRREAAREDDDLPSRRLSVLTLATAPRTSHSSAPARAQRAAGSPTPRSGSSTSASSPSASARPRTCRLGEVEQMIRHLAAVADTYDDRLDQAVWRKARPRIIAVGHGRSPRPSLVALASLLARSSAARAILAATGARRARSFERQHVAGYDMRSPTGETVSLGDPLHVEPRGEPLRHAPGRPDAARRPAARPSARASATTPTTASRGRRRTRLRPPASSLASPTTGATRST